MSTSAQLARRWWDTLDPADRQQVWDSRHGYLTGDLVERHGQRWRARGQRRPLVLRQRRTHRLHGAHRR